MAAPVKNFTDPTNLSKFGPAFFPTVVLPPSIGIAPATAVVLLNNFYPWALTMVGTFSVKPFPQQIVRIPVPPMGRQMVLTFPPVYKTNDANAGGVGSLYSSPRVFPPIFLTAAR